MASDTKERIQRTALELFAAQGVQRTSLREIADRLGITKPALYYHFESREALIRSLLQECSDDGDALLDRLEAWPPPRDPKAILEAYFDLLYRHRHVTNAVMRDLSVLSELDIGSKVVAWRERISALLLPPDATLEARARGVVAIGGLADCTVLFVDVPAEELRPATVAAALAALGIEAPHE